MRAPKTLAADALCHPIVGRAISAIFGGRVPSLRFGGWRIDTRGPSVTPEIVAAIFWGIYESGEIRFIQRHLRRDLDVVELGASIGGVSTVIARHQQPGRRLLCVEANAELIPLLRRNLEANAPDQAVEIVNRAIDYLSTGDTVPFETGRNNVAGRTLGVDPRGSCRAVERCTLSDLLGEHHIDEYILVSDIEGAEAGFILDDAAALQSCRQIVIELHDADLPDRKMSIADLRQSLVDAHGFRLRQHHGAVFLFEREHA